MSTAGSSPRTRPVADNPDSESEGVHRGGGGHLGGRQGRHGARYGSHQIGTGGRSRPAHRDFQGAVMSASLPEARCVAQKYPPGSRIDLS